MSTSNNDESSALSLSEKRVLKNWFDFRAVKNTTSLFWIIDGYDVKNNTQTSPKFESTIVKEFLWFLKLQPIGSSLGEFCLILCPSDVNTCDKIYLRCELSFMKNGKNEVLRSELHCVRLFSGMRSQDCKCCTIVENGNYKLFTIDGCSLYISCKVEFSTDDYCKYASSEANFNALQFSVSEDIANLMKNEMYSDITLSVKDKEFQAHKLILAARSSVFAAMFNHIMKENTTNRVEIKDLDPEVVEEMLHFIYTGKCENLEKFASGLLVAADKYDLKGLKVMCEQALFKNINCENAAGTLLLADLHHADELKSNVIEFIMATSVEVTSSTAWNDLIVENSKLAREVYDGMARRLADMYLKMKI